MSHTRMLSELAPSLVGQVSAEGRIKWVIVNHPTDSKLNSSDLIGRDCRDVLYQDNSDTGNCPIEATIITGIPQKAALPCTDGSKYLLKAYPVRNGSETIEGAMFAVEAMSEAVTDGTEYSHFKAICDNSPYGKIILNLEPLSVIEINQAGLKLFGYTKLSSNDALQDILDATQISKSIEKILPEMKGQESINFQAEFKTRSGNFRECEMFINSISIGGKDAICITIHDVTDTRSAERELQESESMYRSLVENSPDMIMEVTTSGTILYTNRIMKGLSKEEAVGTHMLDYIPREEHVRIRKIIDRALRKKKNTSYEISVINPNGKRWWETRVIPMERDGRVDKLLFIVSDVTHAKRAEEALIKSEENYRNLVEHLPQIVFAHINGKIVYVNHNSYSVMGFKSEADVIGKNLLDFIHHTDRDRMEKLMKTVAVEKGTRKNVEMKIVTMDGDVLDIIGNAIDVEYEGSPARLVVIHDITERKKAEEALRASERQFRYLTENMRDAVWIMDLDWKHKYISPSITNIRGFSTDEIFELPVENSLTPWSLDQANCLMAEAMANNGYDKDGNPYQVTFEQEEYCKDGSTVWTEVRASFVYDDNGNPVGTMGITRDITERREAEKKLTAERNFLEQIVDLNPYGIMTYSKDGYPVSNNRAFFDMFKSVPPPDWNIFNTEYSRKSDLGPYFEKIQKGEVVKIPRHFFNAHEINPKYPDHSCWYQSTTFPIRDTKGQIDKFVAMYEDISEIVRAEEAMSKADSSFQTLADKLPVGMFLFKDQKLIYANRQALEIAGYESLSDIVGINAIEFVDDEHKDVILEKIVDLEKNPDEPQSAQVVMRRADGSTFPVNSIGLNIDFGGEPAIVVMFSRAAEESQVIQ